MWIGPFAYGKAVVMSVRLKLFMLKCFSFFESEIRVAKINEKIQIGLNLKYQLYCEHVYFKQRFPEFTFKVW